MKIEETVEDKPSTSGEGTYAPYEEKPQVDPPFGYTESIVSPWLKKRYRLSLHGLHEEILDIYHWLRPSQVETALRQNVYEKVKRVILEKWKEYDVKVSVFGSLRTKLFLPTSDIDVLVECSEWKDVLPILTETSEALKESNLAETISVYSDAFVPIVKMVDKDTHVSIDISFNTVQGVRAADYIEKVKLEFPVVEPLILILKQFLIQRNLNQTYTGGLSSYGLILMLISFLQIYAMPVRRRSFYDDDVNLGELLMRFFEVYAQEFNYLEVGISVEDFKYRKKMSNFKSPVLSLEDPLLRSNEVGRSTFNFAAVQNSFAQALQVLKGVFVRDRKRNNEFNDLVYKSGSILALIMPFTPQQVEYRCWLKSQSLSIKKVNKPDKMRTPILITNTCISPYINLDTVTWNQYPQPQKTSKPLTIMPPLEKNENSASIINETTSLTDKRNKDDSYASQRTDIEMTPIEKENDINDNIGTHYRKNISPRKDSSPRKDGKYRSMNHSQPESYSSAVHRNTKKTAASKSEKSQTHSPLITARKSDSDITNGNMKHMSIDSKKPEKRPEIAYYNSAARCHRNHVPKSNGNISTNQTLSSEADSEQDNNGFITVKRR